MWCGKKPTCRPTQLFLEDLLRLPPGTLLVRHYEHGYDVIVFKFVRGRLAFIVGGMGKPDTTHLTDNGCIPYDGKEDRWHLTNWLETYEAFLKRESEGRPLPPSPIALLPEDEKVKYEMQKLWCDREEYCY